MISWKSLESAQQLCQQWEDELAVQEEGITA
jgi:hypothetical protein